MNKKIRALITIVLISIVIGFIYWLIVRNAAEKPKITKERYDKISQVNYDAIDTDFNKNDESLLILGFDSLLEVGMSSELYQKTIESLEQYIIKNRPKQTKMRLQKSSLEQSVNDQAINYQFRLYLDSDKDYLKVFIKKYFAKQPQIEISQKNGDLLDTIDL